MSRLLPALLLLLLGAGCSPLYVIRAGFEEAKILSRRESIARLVADSTTEPERRAKLARVLEARRFAAELGLDVGESYTTFSELDSDTLALVLSAAHRDRFVAHTWWFPIVGRVPYKGFFSEGAARREMARLEAKGFDTYLRPTSAFSTLGWFNDPLVSPLLRAGEVDLVNTVIHELVHNTLYLSGEAAFNESFANFVGARGSIAYFCAAEGPDSPECRTARASWEDDLTFGRFLEGLVADLEALYGREDLTSAQKIRMRGAVLEGARSRFVREVKPELATRTFSSFERLPLNNATLIGRRLYYRRLDLFEKLHHAYGGDLSRIIADVDRVTAAGEEPYAAVEGLLRVRERTPAPGVVP